MLMNTKSKRTLIISACVLMGILLITIWLYYRSIHIQKEIDTIQYQNNNVAYEESISLQIVGEYHKRLFKEDYFEGQIQIGGYPFTSEVGWDLVSISFDEGYGHIVYTFFQPESDEEESIMDILRLGYMLCTPSFEQFAIVFFDEQIDNTDEYDSGHWTNENGLFIAYPTTNRDEAITLVNTLFEQNKRLSRFEKWN